MKKSFTLSNGKFRILRLSKLVIDEEKQRDRRAHWLDYLRKNWVPEICGPVVVCPAGNGMYHVPDAGHRLTILQEKHKGTVEIMCQVVSKPEMFRLLNTTLKVNVNDDFKVALGCGGAMETTVAKVLKLNGIGIKFGGKAPLGKTASPAAFLDMLKAVGQVPFVALVGLIASAYRRSEDNQIDPAALFGVSPPT